jgi:hypothetical protein
MLPAPLISPLSAHYATEMARIGKALDVNGSIVVQEFESLGVMAEQIGELVKQATPYQLFVS